LSGLRNFCTRCGSRIGSADRYCGNCGAPLTAGLGPDELNSVLVRELDSGDIVYFRPPEPSSANNSPNEPVDILSAGGEIENILLDSNIPNEERASSEAGERLKTLHSVNNEAFSPLPPIEKMPLSESANPEVFQESYPFPPDIPVIEKLMQLDEMSSSDGTAQKRSEQISEPDPEIFDDIDESVKRFLNDEPPDSQKSDTISLLGWVGIICLLLIPAVNILLLIIWALGGCKKKQKAQFARALLIVIAIIALLIFVADTFFKDYIDKALGYLISSGIIPSGFAGGFIERIIDSLINFGVK